MFIGEVRRKAEMETRARYEYDPDTGRYEPVTVDPDQPGGDHPDPDQPGGDHEPYSDQPGGDPSDPDQPGGDHGPGKAKKRKR